ncbi:N1221-domain-containing protein [Basidiobolus meristosporus CBS 931.73]|uniref:N1221-domain-containing protein n=1 Tax=Basidiobolus meristosporus CBS 931.73 TaxID=1314790 RepID=A0A1Y1XSJ8_9FUNG|nr:N1221-domain-containing protein [Basidiobolus meristosporus CBS 931.73]|eukprot:ORX88703.1 N1221-domain-containing protein [Basidiobolus meristosporus CBS 931.73]
MDSLRQDILNQRKNSLPSDSLTLSQLKQIIHQIPNKNKQLHYQFTYGDTDALPRELDEFFGYREINKLLELRHVMDDVKESDWTERTLNERRDYIEVLLETLELKIGDIRQLAAKALLYISLGTFGECSTPHQHLIWIIENNKTLRSCGALVSFYQGLKLAYANYEQMRDARLDSEEEAECSDKMGQAFNEIDLFLTLIYFLIETHRGEKKFGDELAALDTPILEFLFHMLEKLKYSNRRSFCPKKLLLVIWKTMLAMLGGFDNIELLKNPTRSLNDLPFYYNQPTKPKTTPFDYHHFCFDMSLKFPSFFSDPEENPLVHQFERTCGLTKTSSFNRPFVLPLTLDSPVIPESISEAKEMYEKFMYISPGMIQMHKETELIRRYERGFLEKDERFTEYMDQSDDIAWKINAKQTTEQIQDEENKIHEARGILSRIENLYTSLLPITQNMVVILLKMLLATINNNNNNSDASKKGKTTKGDPGPLFNPETLDMQTIGAIETTRYKEIITKAISAIILLLLKYYKLNHILKFEYLCQLLLDSNCLLLILKIFSEQDVSVTTSVRNDIKQLNFMQYSRYSSAKLPVDINTIKQEIFKAQERNEAKYGSKEGRQKHANAMVVSWRNMFSAINLFRILQKLTKRKKHRILPTVLTYKSTNMLKRVLKVTQPQLQLYALKFLKNQIPYLGRKWRQSNMKLVTSIYMYCRPELKEDWMCLIEGEEQLDEAMGQEQSLRAIISFYNEVRYPQIFPKPASSGETKRSSVGSTESSLEHSLPENELLDDNFKLNYEKWLQDEVFYNTPPTEVIVGVSDYYEDDLLEHAGILSPRSPDTPHFFADDGSDEAAGLSTDLNSESISRIEREIKAKHEMLEDEDADLDDGYMQCRQIDLASLQEHPQ